MNTLAKIFFVLLVIFGGVFFVISYDPSTAKVFPPAIWGITTVGGYFIGAAGTILSVVGAIGFVFKQNLKFWHGFQPVNVGIPIAVWSCMGIYNQCSWLSLAVVTVALILISKFAWKKVIELRALPVSLMLLFITTADIKGVMQYVHLEIAFILIVIPIGLMLKQYLYVSFGSK